MNIMKSIFYVFVLTLFSSMTFAQTGFHKYGVGAEVGLPMGNFGNAYGIGFGATGKVFYGLNDKSDITGTLGYMRFGMKKDNDMISGSMGMIPIVLGYRYDFGGLYGEPQLGFTVLKSKINFDDMGLGLSGLSGTGSTTKFSLGLGGGYDFGSLDVGARFQIIDNLNFLGLRLGFNF